ncbi:MULTISPECIES: D-aminoacyl-tRNA deacylase [Gammaproteobacteria]|uniref:D-aminoacyl-tRNA deacylase n=1 Tax=Gammaproteobacteria TaxID=1236 RepID=UPI000DCFEB9C|nr:MULTISPECIES: D-aminoacyl-tRNA deacylase [Gammaproteobacteria]RTE85893.1 D-tyrosyl-tRNA(Tyr) deacylase [Aliidiomarina sp. B3213]TCZ90107.1 D-tyrosyl-tRNA(Tyr) deacylase [Lysobacter sp. N42]
MIGLIQRVQEARVEVEKEVVGQIGQGVLVFLGVEKTDTDAQAIELARRISSYRIFSDHEDKMNLDVKDIQGEVLVVSQFTLAADTRKGRRPSFSSAGSPASAQRLYHVFCDALRAHDVPVATGQFAADMQVHIVNDGPVTFYLKTNAE